MTLLNKIKVFLNRIFFVNTFILNLGLNFIYTMVLNYIWISFFVIAFVIAFVRLIFFGDTEIFPQIMQSIFDSAETGFTLSLGLTGVLTLWLGLMKIGEKGGVINFFAKIIAPLFTKIFPNKHKNHPAIGAIVMNISANMLGLDNAATPLGLKAMDEMQKLNKKKDTASNSQIMFLVLNTSGLTIIPISIMVYRAELGAADPSDIFIPILLATYFSTIAGLITVSLFQKINLINKVVLGYIGTLTVVIIGIIIFFSTLEKEQVTLISQISSNFILFGIITTFVLVGFIKKINVYESFIEGAKDGFKVAVKIIPYLIAILVSIAAFRTSGAMDILVLGVEKFFVSLGVNSDFVPALPTALMKPLSGGGARGMLIDTMKIYGVDSFPARVASTIQGSTETTFYVIAVYFGSVGIKKTRYAIACGLIADFVGIIAAILLAYLFFH